MDQTPFSEQLKYLGKGSIDAELTEELTELVKLINERHKGGSITLTLKLKPKLANNEVAYVQIDADISSTMPKVDRLASHLFPTYDGDLLRNDPDQRQLDLRQVDTERPQPRDLNETGSEA